ncbi:universal stress protein [Mesorhizobium sp. ESP7-2]|uniref:universal stress protein n=1 Tax=Mesorhizobium sp. ESP7-2 TaxID=2876622 RepID=UPI001CC8FABC|nr:universal stress protein [Mesorhizobium sp. ESP7-2]MBZ9708564.1 universal stress protein [Mesorhizobium sp. ESP7-2]
MAYRSILLALDIDSHAAALIKLGVDLAKHFDARLIGISAADVPPPVVAAEGVVFDGEIMMRQREHIERRLEELRIEFESIAGETVNTEWRGAIGNPTRLLIKTARMADLIVTGSPHGASVGNVHRTVDLGNLLLHAGRPLMAAAIGAEHLLVNRILVAWKDTREARRAVAAAIPILSLAKEVGVITVDDVANDDMWKSLADVTAYLCYQGVKTRAEILPWKTSDWTIGDIANALHVDLIVSGAYGHSRLTEWAFGGVTRSLLEEHGLHRFMSN